MAVLTVAQKLAIADISQYLAVSAIKKGGLYGAGVPLDLPQKIYNLKSSIQYRYDIDPSDDTLEDTSNYLYSICRFVLQAQSIIQIAGSVSGIITSTSPSPYQFIVDASTSFIIDGQSSKTITSFIGSNLIFVRGGITQNTTDDGSGSYYSWTRATGSFICYPAASTGEVFGLFPI